MIKIVVGGLLAFPIAYLMVLWLFHQDPLNLGPSLEKVAPFVVPADLRGPEPASEEDIAPSQPEISVEDEEPLPIPDVDPDNIRGVDIK